MKKSISYPDDLEEQIQEMIEMGAVDGHSEFFQTAGYIMLAARGRAVAYIPRQPENVQ